jgi:hypothetical protein
VDVRLAIRTLLEALQLTVVGDVGLDPAFLGCVTGAEESSYVARTTDRRPMSEEHGCRLEPVLDGLEHVLRPVEMPDGRCVEVLPFDGSHERAVLVELAAGDAEHDHVRT